MLVKVIQPVVITWVAPSNSDVDNKIAKRLSDNVYYFETNFIPQIGEYIHIEGCESTFLVKRVDRFVVGFGKEPYNSDEKFEVTVQRQSLSIHYYDWHKKYTHAFDNWKNPDDPSIDFSKSKDPIVYPETWDEWVKQAEELRKEKFS